jgi:hypothetical protein
MLDGKLPGRMKIKETLINSTVVIPASAGMTNKSGVPYPVILISLFSMPCLLS